MKFSYELHKSYIIQFLSNLLVERNLSSNTIKAYQYDLENLLNWHKTQQELSSKTIIKYFDWLQNTRSLSSRSIYRKYVSIQQFCNFLLQENYTNEIFFRFSTRRFQLPKSLPRTLRKNELRDLILSTEKEYKKLDNTYRKNLCARDMCIIELLFCLGLRISEISNILLEDYNADAQCLLIHGKGKKERILYIASSAVINKIKIWLSIRPQFKPNSNHIFINKYGNRLSIYGIEKMFKKYKSLSGINPQATPHYLRHTFASQLLNNGANLRDVQELLGHSSIVTTEIYTEITLERKKEVMTRYNERNFLF